jgi:hypothetical protein
LGVGRQHFLYRVLKFTPGRDAPLHLLRPISGDALDVSLALHHEGQSPSLMALLVSTTAAGIPAARVTPGEGPGQQMGWNGETMEQLKLALAEVFTLRVP